jgi:DNA-binding HxlR family transcriptional regulator
MPAPKNSRFCPIIKPIEMLGDSWTLMILKTLLGGAKRFNELKSEVEDINGRTLSARLKTLQSNGLVVRKVMEQNPPQVIYQLTPLGKGSRPVIEAVEEFGNRYLCS